MRYVIDGFNLMYKFPECETLIYENQLGNARRALLKNILKLNEVKKSYEFHIFFDGRKEKESVVVRDEWEGMRLYYSHEIKADDFIKMFIRKAIDHATITLVSSDKEIIHYGKKYGCKTIKSEDFYIFLGQTLKKKEKLDEKDADINLSNTEVSYWLKMFKDKKNVG
ncbi:MAG: NYN domain-containing protein [Leptospiraceae bacterium]|nr:NYN domain-containing protein [Leptospiraceae bacterium]MCP5510322.1 NYN domain-containing protein [Leptospiraceae bacterium]